MEGIKIEAGGGVGGGRWGSTGEQFFQVEVEMSKYLAGGGTPLHTLVRKTLLSVV